MSRDVLKIPDHQYLRDAALSHLARFSATEKGLYHVLERRLKRWGARAEREGMLPEEIQDVFTSLQPCLAKVVADMVSLGAIDDTQFARTKAENLTRTGRSRRAVEAHLAMKGVDQDLTQHVLDEALGHKSDDAAYEAELGAALTLARKRRLGPFCRPDKEEDQQKALGIFARNGFSQNIAMEALHMGREEAEDKIITLRSRL
ncbi:regulatory protein RecX [Swingsia samuiensis]|uniref:Regulatory protein RecX n=1 Tax=Swingsia samuiensis TaxID=1293412 RepID=A0A4Y6UJW5_9PROT|nr:RecX family transcriptional regulator [Swingsia samuiensis]QDH16766.1 regulatory protein RecX [Swingsia samuiensis]